MFATLIIGNNGRQPRLPLQHGAFIPLSTIRERFGERNVKRSSGSLEMEKVDLHQILVRVDNTDHVLRNNMFGEVRILLGSGVSALSIPKRAVQRFEQKPFVFVKLDEDLFELRRVALGNATRNRVQIVKGLAPDESVVVSGSFTMMSEFLKSRLGAGCVDD